MIVGMLLDQQGGRSARAAIVASQPIMDQYGISGRCAPVFQYLSILSADVDRLFEALTKVSSFCDHLCIP